MRQKIYLLLPLFAVVLYCNSCNLPSGPGYGTGTLTLLLPETTNQKFDTTVQNKTAAVSRSVLSDNFTGGLVYRITFTGPGETRILEAGGGGTTVSLEAGVWSISAEAYTDTSYTTKVGEGSAAITIVAGRNSSVRIPMTVDPAYEMTLTEIYIHSEKDLRRVAEGIASGAFPAATDFWLENDIYLTQPWTPIGDDTTPFTKNFNGQNHTITINSFDLNSLTDPHREYLGIFGMLNYNAKIKDLNIVCNVGNVEFPVVITHSVDDIYVGAVAGWVDSSRIENVTVSGIIALDIQGNTSSYIGGIAGLNYNPSAISSCHVRATIRADSLSHIRIGGLAGEMGTLGATIEKSSFTGEVVGYSDSTAHIYAGGIVGYASLGSAISCYATGEVSAFGDTAYAGGIAGQGSIIQNCYAWADVFSYGDNWSYAGGIVGQIMSGCVVSKCYSRGNISVSGNYLATMSGGGIAGLNYLGTIEYCAALNGVIDSGYSTNLHGIAGKLDTICYFTSNYAASDISVQQNGGWTANADLDGDITYARADFINGGGFDWADATTVNWNFTPGTGDWKWLSGYDYPVLQWQTSPPTGGPLPPS